MQSPQYDVWNITGTGGVSSISHRCTRPDRRLTCSFYQRQCQGCLRCIQTIVDRGWSLFAITDIVLKCLGAVLPRSASRKLNHWLCEGVGVGCPFASAQR